MLNLLIKSLLFSGAGILVASLIPIRRLISQLPDGVVRRRWFILAGMTLIFIIGYIYYAITFWYHQSSMHDLIVPVVFFLGACFVWLIFTLSLQATIDIRRVAILEYESQTDQITGLYNRRYLDRRLQEEFARFIRYSIPLSIILIDIDNFKYTNDILGHQVGDLVLNHVGKIILDAVRATDIVTRYGGDEIMVIATNTPLSSTVVLAERIRKNIESNPLVISSETNKQQEVQIQVSAGVACCCPETDNIQELILRADDSLYHAKHQGRNQIVVYSKGYFESSMNYLINPVDE